jgi:hypothetical protein
MNSILEEKLKKKLNLTKDPIKNSNIKELGLNVIYKNKRENIIN